MSVEQTPETPRTKTTMKYDMTAISAHLTVCQLPAKVEPGLLLEQLGEGEQVKQLDGGVHGEPLRQHELRMQPGHSGFSTVPLVISGILGNHSV